jgi:lipoyl-dependent peroxiredoxin
MQRKASAKWNGGLKDGKGAISTSSGVLKDTQYGFTSRFESGAGTNPEELVAASHAGCFTMALSAQLENAGHKAESLATECTVTFEKLDAGWTVTQSHLDVRARVPGIDNAKFQELAGKAETGCPISRLLNAKITMDAKLEG